MTPSRLSGLFLETMGPPTLDEFCTLCELLGQSAPDTLQSVITESETATPETPDDKTTALADTDPSNSVPDMSGWTADEQAAYVVAHMDHFDIAAKKGDIEREQTEYEDLP